MAQAFVKLKKLARNLLPEPAIGFYHLLLSFLGAVFYGFPSGKMKVIGVTGTNGKSSVVEMIHTILLEAGYKAAAFSSISFKINKDSWDNDLKMTMPGRFKLQNLLNQAKKAGCEYVVLEVTSEGIKQYRHRFINFKTAVFTNLSPEHIESHGSFENYRAAKEELFKAAKKVHVVNLDDRNVKYFSRHPATSGRR